MSMRPDPISVLLRSVRVVGEEFCWPAAEVLEVLDAFKDLNRVVLGAELWRFDDDEAPSVLGWTQYDVPEAASAERVETAHRMACDELMGHTGDMTAWVNLIWE